VLAAGDALIWSDGQVELSCGMQTSDAIRGRRSIKRFTGREVTREEMEALLDAAVLAPNHRLTQPWRFYVLGPEARYAYGFVLGGRKAKKIEDPTAAAAMRQNVANEHRALPGMIAVAMIVSENEEQREEDYAATLMAVQNLSLAAVEMGLGTHIKTGAVMSDPAARAAAGVHDDKQRIVAVVNVGTPAEEAPAKKREPASAFTTWMA
jgi:nitroreductase